MQKGNINHAVDEFNKSLKFNNKDVFARTNLTYIYILNNEFELAEKELKILEKQDTTTSAVLKNILNQNKLDQTKINN